jgi:hypothetical protein
MRHTYTNHMAHSVDSQKFTVLLRYEIVKSDVCNSCLRFLWNVYRAFFKIENNDIQQMHFSMFIIYTNTPTCFGPSELFRPLWTIFRELHTVECDLAVKQYAVNIKQFVGKVVS